jgi:glyoxylase-like metal-dependent hydrolase (beta-lactamase superfamily II)
MPLQVKQLSVGQLQANCYIAWDDNSGKAIVIDPGDEADFIIGQVNRLSLSVGSIIATHGHFDHLMAVNELKLAFNVPFFIHKADKFLLDRMRETTKHFLSLDPGPGPIPDKYLDKVESIIVGNYRIGVIPTPGHTPGSVCLYSQISSIVFTGDLIFANGAVGRTDFQYSSQKDLKTSIEKILKLPPKTTVYSGHGKETTIKRELEYFVND